MKGDRMPHPKDNLSSQLDYEGWRDLLRSMCGRYYSEGIEPNSFSGWVRAVSARGFTALDIGSNAQRVERTYQDVRRDARITISRSFRPVANWRCCTTIKIAVGDVALVDAARPVTYSADKGDQWNTVSLSLPRQSLVSYLGFEPQGGLYRSSGTPAGRLLFDL
ncbi:MAG: hypothetical protein WCD73_21235, partial [Pseudolabrys sp.]